MIAVLSPAKTLDLDTLVPPVEATQPRFLAEAVKLAKVAAKLKPAKLRELMHISAPLADLNAARFAAFKTPFTPGNARPALYTFDGDVYAGLQGPKLDATTVDYAQRHVRILSGLYGLLRPLDLIQPYRLEMGIKLATLRKADLYSFWGDRIARALAEDLADHADRTLINLASVEYFDAVAVKRLPGPVVNIDFRDVRDGELRFNTFIAKRTRGAMARFLCEQRIETPTGLKEFAEDGYCFMPKQSDETRLLFVRQAG